MVTVFSKFLFHVLQFDYAIDLSQLSFLKSLSSRATQRLSFQCKKVSVINNEATSSQEQAVRLWSDNDVEMTFQHAKHSYTVIQDDCQVRYREYASPPRLPLTTHFLLQYKKGSVGESIIEVTGRPQRLPIRDAALMDVGRPGQQIGVAIGEVCFT